MEHPDHSDDGAFLRVGPFKDTPWWVKLISVKNNVVQATFESCSCTTNTVPPRHVRQEKATVGAGRNLQDTIDLVITKAWGAC